MNGEQFSIWFAGFLDGEGCIALYRHPKCKNLNPMVQITSTSESILRFIYSRLKVGNIIKRKIYDVRAKQSWAWRTSGSGAHMVCMLVLPYLQLKKPQAELVIEYWSGRIAYSMNKREWKERIDNDKFVNQSFKLNRKGKIR